MRRASSLRRRGGGFTLVELMVVLTILAIVMALSLSSFRYNATGDDARELSSLMSTAYRTAVAGGPVRADVAEAKGVRARAQLEIKEQDGRTMATIYRLVEDDLPTADFQWVAVQSFTFDSDVTVYRVMDSAQIGLASSTVDPGGLPATKLYNPNGTADAFTVYLKHRTRQNATRYRVVGMPLSPAPQVFQDW